MWLRGVLMRPAIPRHAWPAPSQPVLPTMTPTKRPAKKAKHPWQNYRENARASLQDAENKLALLEDGANAKGVAADAVLAAVGFGDAITVQRLNRHNVDDHGMLPELIERALGKEADPPQLTRLRRILKEKSRAQYGGAFWTEAEAENYLEQVRRFSSWAEEVLAARE